jgi:hypothetical protein
MRAATWAKNKLTEWGLSNANLEPWGEFGKGWEQTKCYVAMTGALLCTIDRYALVPGQEVRREKNQ